MGDIRIVEKIWSQIFYKSKFTEEMLLDFSDSVYDNNVDMSMLRIAVKIEQTENRGKIRVESRPFILPMNQNRVEALNKIRQHMVVLRNFINNNKHVQSFSAIAYALKPNI